MSIGPGKVAVLADRGVISVTGPDAAKLLDGVITNDMDLLETQPAIYAGLLTPQGKLLADFFVVKAADGFLIDVTRDRVGDLIKRLTMYRLRAKAEIGDVSQDYAVLATWGAATGEAKTSTALAYADPRLPAMGRRVLARAPIADGADLAVDYHEHRIAQGVPEGGRDWAFGDTFAHEALLDQLNGVSFTKGCYVGQEIVARMQHRGTARKRIVRVFAPGALPQPGAEIAAGEAVIGTLGSVSGHEGLALIRLDRAAEAIAKGVPLAAGPVRIEIEIQPWATFQLVAANPPPA